MNLGHIAIKKQAMIKFKNNSQAPNPHYIDLVSMQTDFTVFNFMPRLFTITTNNSSCKFNTDILIGTSTVISNFIQKNPSNLHYHLNTNDDKNVLSKFEQIYQGESVQFDKSEIRISQLIAEELNLFGFNDLDSFSVVHRNFTNQKKSNFLSTSNVGSRIQFRIKEQKVEIDQSSIRSYLQKNAYYSFNIKTNKHEYRCSFYGALFSSVIREFISNEPNSKIFNFDYEDNEKEFQSICDLFNFKKVLLTSRNIDAIKEMAELLGIDCIFKSIDEFIDENERVSKSIDDQQKIIDSIDYLFDLLYNIKEKTVDFVANFIEDSKWSQTKEDVYELAAFILQVVQTNILLHQYLIELLLKLDKNENDKKNQLNLLLPFVVDYSISLFNKEMTTSNPNLIFPFVYQLYKREIIPKDKLKFKGSNLENQYFVSWFLPELADCNSKFDKIDIKKGEIRICRKNKRDEDFYSNSRFIACDVNDIEEYKIMRDKGEYDDDLARAIRNDDVDHFQSIVSKSDGKFLKNKVKKNIFEPFFNSDMNYLNYAAAYGSIKCFKYLHLNHQKVDQLTFEMAIIGGNIEIIRIVDNEKFDESVKNNFSINAIKFGLKYENNPLKVLIQAIKYHKNDLFDWILEQKFSKINQNENLLSLIESSLINGNIHSFVQLVDTGFDIHNYSKKYNQFMSDVSEKGFYSFADFLLKIIKKEDDQQIISCNPTSAVCFGNIKIFKLFENSMRQSDLYEALILAIKKNYMNIIKYFFETLVNQNFSLNSQNSIEILAHCFANDSKEVLDYLIENINKLHLFNIDSLCLLLDKTTKHQNVEAYKTISELIYQINPKSDFTSLFFKSSVWNLKDLICHFIDRKYIKNDFDLAEKIIKDGSIDLDIYKLLMNNIDSRNKKRMLNIIDKVIQKRNKPFIKYLLDENAPLDDSLIFAVDTKDLEIVELILERNCEPSYINKITKYGTALFVAVKNNSLPIIKRLLSLPGINPNIYCQSNMTPLILAGSKLKIEAFDALLEFYGDKIKDQKDQLENIIKYIISYYPNGYASKNTKNEMILSNNGSHSDLSTILTKIIKLNCIDLNFSIQTNFNDIDHKAQSTTLLFYACRINEISVVEALIESDSIDVNIYDPETGNTPLIESIKIHNINIAKLLIKNPKTKINIRNFAGQSALVEAAQSFRIHKEIFYFLINDEKFNEEESNINYAFFISCNESLFAFKSLNVSYIPLNVPSSCIKNIDYKSIIITPIIRAIFRNDNELLDSIVNHPSYVKDVFQLINTIYIIISDFNKVTFDLFSKVFKLLEEFDIDINSPVFSGNCILVEAIKLSNNYEIISKILNYPGFDSQKSNILLAFNLAYNSINGQKDVLKRCMKTKVMDMLYDYDIKHNHLIDLTCQKKMEVHFYRRYIQLYFLNQIQMTKLQMNFLLNMQLKIIYIFYLFA